MCNPNKMKKKKYNPEIILYLTILNFFYFIKINKNKFDLLIILIAEKKQCYN